MSSDQPARFVRDSKPSKNGFLWVVATVLVIGLFALPATASAKDNQPAKEANDAKVDLCHAKGDGHGLTSVSANAVNSHVKNHDDGLPGDAIPSMDGYNFGENCEPVPACADATVFGMMNLGGKREAVVLRTADGTFVASSPNPGALYHFEMQVSADVLPGAFTIGSVNRFDLFNRKATTFHLDCGQVFSAGDVR